MPERLSSAENLHGLPETRLEHEPDRESTPSLHSPAPFENAPLRQYEEKSLSCAPHQLETLAAAEAVDGWAIFDTTVDPESPGDILVQFRRPLAETKETQLRQRNKEGEEQGEVPD